MKMRPYIPGYSLTAFTFVAGIAIFILTYYGNVDVVRSIESIADIARKVQMEKLLFGYSIIALALFLLIRIRGEQAAYHTRQGKKNSLKLGYAVISTILGLLIFAFILANIWGSELSRIFTNLVGKIKDTDIDSWMLFLSSILTAMLVDTIRIQRIEKIKHAERMYTLQITMRTVQDVVGNFMNNIQLYKIKAEETGALDEESLSELNKLIYSTSDKLNSLAALKIISEKEVAEDLYILDINANKNSSEEEFS